MLTYRKVYIPDKVLASAGGTILVFNYIRETGRVLARKAAYVGAVAAFTLMAYMPGTANAQEAP